MKKFKYVTLEGAKYIFADKYEEEIDDWKNLSGEINKRTDYVFYVGERIVFRIPASYVLDIQLVNGDS